MTARPQKSVDREILRLALPAIVNNITVPLLGLCDTAIAGHLGSAIFLGAMSVGAMMLNVIYWLCGFLRMGTSGLTAQAFGAGDMPAGRDVLSKAMTIAACLSVTAILLQTPLLRLLLAVIGPDPEVTAYASLYFRICIWAAPAQLGIMAVSGWFIGRQNTVVPMTVAIGVNVINILMSLLLVFVWHCGFAGIAAGTLTAAWIGFAGALLFVRRELAGESSKTGDRIKTKDNADGNAGAKGRVRWKLFFSVNGNLFFRSACIMCVSLTMTSVSARLGELTLAANAVIMQFFLFFSYFMDGFAFAGEALVGRAAGARDGGMLHLCVRSLLRWGAWMALAFLLVYMVASGPITSLLTDVASVRQAVDEMHIWVVVLPPVAVSAFIFDGIFIGLARTGSLLVSTLIASAIFFATVFLGPRIGETLSNPLLWTAFEIYLLMRGVLLASEYVKIQRKSLIL